MTYNGPRPPRQWPPHGVPPAVLRQSRERRELDRLLDLLWRCHDEGALPAELDSLLLGEFHHLRPGGEARPKSELVAALREIAARGDDDPEVNHGDADKLLLDFIASDEVREAFGAIGKWYA